MIKDEDIGKEVQILRLNVENKEKAIKILKEIEFEILLSIIAYFNLTKSIDIENVDNLLKLRKLFFEQGSY